MIFKKNISLKILTILIFISCSNNKTEKIQNKSKRDSSVPALVKKMAEDSKYKKNGYDQRWKVNEETFADSGKSVIFFAMNQQEYDLYKKDNFETEEIDVILDDFIYHSGTATEIIEKKGFEYKIHHITERFISLRTSEGKQYIFDKYKDCDNIVGYLIFDGKNKPQINCGVDVDVEIVKNIELILK